MQLTCRISCGPVPRPSLLLGLSRTRSSALSGVDRRMLQLAKLALRFDFLINDRDVCIYIIKHIKSNKQAEYPSRLLLSHGRSRLSHYFRLIVAVFNISEKNRIELQFLG